MYRELYFKNVINDIVISYIYDDRGISGAIYKNHKYKFIKNILGDIILIVNESLDVICEYTYTAYGAYSLNNLSAANSIDSEFVSYNPFTYRGYYKDHESNLYYLINRYYSPDIEMFITPDSFNYLDPSTLYGLDLYTYCMFNPVMYSDESGRFATWKKWAIGVGIIAGFALLTVVTAGIAGVGVGAAFTAGFSGGAIGAGASGLAVTIAGSAFAGATIGASIGMVSGALVGGLVTGSWQGAYEGAANGFMIGAITGAISGGIRGGVNFARSAPLYRSVSSAELDSLKNSGQFSEHGTMTSKWFATTKNDASKWASWFGQKDYVGVRVAKSSIKDAYYSSFLDAIGPAYCIEIDVLNSALFGMWFF